MPQQKKARNYELTRRFLPYYRRYWKLLVFDLLCASLTTVCDLLARTLFAPYEIPVGILLSLMGGPFFLWLLMRRGRKGARG